MSLALHDDVSWLAFLLGTWRGEGTGEYPTIEPFTYRETVTFDHAGDAWFSYIQESWTPDGKPLHFERGFLRPGNADGDVEFVLAHPIGVTEVALIMYLIGAPVSWLDALIIEALSQPIRAAAVVIPGGLGTQEWGGVALCRMIGMPEDVGATLLLLKRGRELVLDGVGLAYLVRVSGLRAATGE